MKTSEIASLLGAELSGDPDTEILNVADISSAGRSDLAFANNVDEHFDTQAGCVIVPKNASASATSQLASFLTSENPKLDFAKAAAKILKADNAEGIHSSVIIGERSNVNARSIGAFVVVGEETRIADGCTIGSNSTIGNNVTIGSDTVIHRGVRIYDNVTIGSGCVIHSGAVIGAAGFGFVRDSNGEYIPFPQIGETIIEDRVEIGANTCIDRGALTETRIGSGTKIDNLVQIAHNVMIGTNCVIAAQTGISGSTVIEDGCVIGGQVGIGDHATIKTGAIIGSQAGVLSGKILRAGVWWGTPTQPLDDIKKQHFHIKRLEKLKEDVQMIKKKNED